MDVERLCKLIEVIRETWNRLAITIKEVMSALQKAFEHDNNVIKKGTSRTSPKKYGRSLVSNIRTRSCLRKYHYIPTVRKNLPYQRRRF